MLKIEFTGQFKKDYKLAIKRGCNSKKLSKVVSILCNEQPLPEAYQDHALINSKNYKGMRECHIQPNWLLIYKISQNVLVLKLIRTGTHSDLFKQHVVNLFIFSCSPLSLLIRHDWLVFDKLCLIW